MKTYLIKPKNSDIGSALITNQHFGYDAGKIRWHGLGCANEDSLYGETPIQTLEKIDKEHKFCIRFPWIAKFNKELYTRVT